MITVLVKLKTVFLRSSFVSSLLPFMPHVYRGSKPEIYVVSIKSLAPKKSPIPRLNIAGENIYVA